MADLSGRERTAPFYPIPPRRIVSVEHPGVIKNVNRAIDTLDGNDGIARVCKKRWRPLLALHNWNLTVMISASTSPQSRHPSQSVPPSRGRHVTAVAVHQRPIKQCHAQGDRAKVDRTEAEEGIGRALCLC
jgi:hypothetical protein